MEEKRKKCSYPMSEFYIYKDEIKEGERVSTIKDCDICDGFHGDNCHKKFCLISE